MTNATKTKQPTMPKQASWPLAAIKGHKQIQEVPEHAGGGRERTLPEQMTITIPLSTKTTWNIFLLGFTKKESVPNSPQKKWLLTTFYLVPSGGTR